MSDNKIKRIDEEIKPIDKETKILILRVLKRGYFEKSDFDYLVKNYDYKPDAQELSGSISIEEWIWSKSTQNKAK